MIVETRHALSLHPWFQVVSLGKVILNLFQDLKSIGYNYPDIMKLAIRAGPYFISRIKIYHCRDEEVTLLLLYRTKMSLL